MRSIIFSISKQITISKFLFPAILISISFLPNKSYSQCPGGPVLVVNTPAPVCSPATISLLDLIDPSSTLPAGTVLYYYYLGTGSLVSDPSAVSQSGMYRITANTPTCTDAKDVQVTINQTPIITPFNFPFCSGDQNTYLLSGQNVGTWNGPGVVLQSNAYYFKPSSAGVGTHTLVAIPGSNSCQASMQVVVTQAPVLVLNTPAPVCSPATINLTQLISPSSIIPQGTVLYYYYSGNNGLTSVSDPSAVSQSGTYRITATTPDFCGDVKEVQVTINQSPIVTPFNFSFCSDNQNLVIPNGQFVGVWSGPGIVYQSNTFYFRPSSAGPGTHTLVATGGTGNCQASMPVVVKQAPVLVLNTPAPVCSPATIDLTQLISPTSIIPQGTILYYYYSGTNGLTSVSDPSAVSQSGTYRITATTPDFCGDVKEVQLTINQSPIVTPFNFSFCSDNQNLVIPNGQFVGVWSGPGIVYQSNTYYFKPSSAGPGTHTLVATGGVGGCQASMPVVVTQAPKLVLNTPAPVCSPATINLTQLISPSSIIPQGSTLFYYYSDNNGLTSVSDPSAVTQSGTYRITANSPDGCTDGKEVQVTINQTPIVTPFNFSFCSDNQNLVIPNGQFVGVWSGPGIIYQSNTYYFKPSSAGPGTHTLVATGGVGGCQASMPVVVTQAPKLVLNTPAPVCSPATINLTQLISPSSIIPQGSTLFYYYSDNNGLTSVSDPSAVTQSGTYRITANSPDGCTDGKEVQVTINQTPIVTPFNFSFCSDNQNLVIPNGQFVGVWSGPGIIYQSNTYYFKPSSAGPGTHTLVATGGVGACQASMPVVVTQAPVLVLNTPVPVCSPSTINLSTLINTSASTLPMGTVFQYFNNGTLMGSPVVNQSGTYTVRAFSPSGCINEQSVVVTISQTPTLPNIGTTYCSNDQKVSLGTEFVPFYMYPGIPHWSGPGIEFTDVSDGSSPANYNRTYYFNPADAGAGTHTITKTGDNLNCTASMQITVLDPPSLTNCPADITVNNQTGQCGALVNYTSPTVAGTCGNPTLTRNGPASGSVFPIGTTTIVFTLKDGSGNTLSTCSFKIMVTDTEKPILNCNADQNLNSDQGQCGASYNVTPTATDNCPGVLVTGVRSDGQSLSSIYPIGITSITWTATDASGNTKTCSQKITVTDNEKPVITCPANISKNSDQGSCGANVSINTPTATDNCGVPTVTGMRSDGLSLNAVYPIGTTTITWTATDANGNFSNCTQTIGVADNELPVITCPTNVVVNTAAGLCSATVNLTPPTATDNCGIPTVTGTRSDGQLLTAAFPRGTTSIEWKATDAYGNVKKCTQTITVNDVQLPTITAPSAISKSADNGKCYASAVTLGVPVTGDNCGVASVINNAPATFPVGNTTVTWTVTDINGNTKTATQIVTVKDNEKPNVSGATVKNFCNGSNGYTVDPIVASDNCGILSITFSVTGATVRNGTGVDASGNFAAGTSFINWTVKDVNGNVSTWQTKVNVGNAISLTIPDAMALGGGVAPNTVYIGYTPASSIKLKAVPTGGTGVFTYNWSNGATTQSITVSPTSSTVYTVTVSDGSGCTKTANKTINVVDIRCGTNKVNLCCKSGNNYQTVCVPTSQVPAYLIFGATLGSCTPTTSVTHQRNEAMEQGMKEKSALSMKAYPNPSKASFIIEPKGLDAKTKAQIVVYNVLGMVVERREVKPDEKIKIGDTYKPGTYIVELNQGKERIIIKLVKQSS